MNLTDPIETEAPISWRYYLNVGLRCRWWLIVTTIVAWAAALILSMAVPPRYKSETLVLVEPGAAHAQYVAANLSLDLQQRLQSLAEQTLSHPRLVQLITDFRLYDYVPGHPVSDGALKRMRNDISLELTKTAGGDISAFKISYSGTSPQMAQKVTSALSSLFIQDSLSGQQRLTDDTASFLTSQLEVARQNVDQQANLLQQFRSHNLGELPEVRAINLQALSGLQERLHSATESLHQAERQKLYLGSMIGWSGNGANSSGTDPAASFSTPLDEQIEKMKTELARLTAQYTPRHPDVVHLRDQIAEAEKQRHDLQSNASPVRRGDSAPVPNGPQRAASPLTQMQSEFKANELEITNRKAEISDLEGQIRLYQGRLDRAPITEQQVSDATRNFEQARAYYESLLAKKQQAEIATDLSHRQQNAQFRTIDPPTLPQKPDWPNRLKFSAMGLFFGIVLGCVGIVMKEAVDARVLGEDDLVRLVPVQVLAIVPPLTTADENKNQARRRRMEIAVVSLLLLAVPLLTLAAALKS